MISRKDINNNLSIYVLILFGLITCFVRYIVFLKYGIFSNDDIEYLPLAENLFSGKGISIDGVNPHLHFPPGYPIIIGIESLFIKDPYKLRMIEWVFLTLVISSLTFYLSRLLNLKNRFICLILSFFLPCYLFGIATLNVASEIWFSIFIYSGLIFLTRFLNKYKIRYLYISNFIFGFAYLIRPEGIFLFLSTIISVIYFIYVSNKISFIYWFKLLTSFIIPLSVTVIPYIYFLYINSGELKISGKDTEIDVTISQMHTGTLLERYIHNFFGFFDFIFLSPYFFGLVFTCMAVLVLLRVKTIYSSIKLFNMNTIDKQFINRLIVIAPIVLVFYISIRYWLLARSVYGFAPSFIILLLLLIDLTLGAKLFYLKIINLLRIRRSILYTFLLALVMLNTVYPLASQNFLKQNPKLYYDFERKNREQFFSQQDNIIYSRLNLSSYNNNLINCGHLHQPICTAEVDFLMLSNFNAPPMSNLENWELNSLKKQQIRYNQQYCSLVDNYEENETKNVLALYKCD